MYKFSLMAMIAAVAVAGSVDARGWKRASDEVQVKKVEMERQVPKQESSYGWNKKADEVKQVGNDRAAEAGKVAEQKVSKAEQMFGDHHSEAKLEEMTSEHNLHERRMAKISRIEELAAKSNNHKVLRSCQQMRIKEAERHANMMQKLQLEK